MQEFKQSIKDLKYLFKDEIYLYNEADQCGYLVLSNAIGIPLSNDLPDFFYKKIKDLKLKTNYPLQSVDPNSNFLNKKFIEREVTEVMRSLFKFGIFEDWKLCLEEKNSPRYIIFKSIVNSYIKGTSLIKLNYLLCCSEYASRLSEKISYLPEDYEIVQKIYKLEDLLHYNIEDKIQLLRVICLFLLKNKHIPTKYL